MSRTIKDSAGAQETASPKGEPVEGGGPSQDAFRSWVEALHASCHRRLVGRIRRGLYPPTVEEAEDIAATVWLRFIESFEHLHAAREDEASAWSWLKQAAYRERVNLIRRKARQGELLDDRQPVDATADGRPPDQRAAAAEDAELTRRVQEMVRNLYGFRDLLDELSGPERFPRDRPSQGGRPRRSQQVNLALRDLLRAIDQLQSLTGDDVPHILPSNRGAAPRGVVCRAV